VRDRRRSGEHSRGRPRSAQRAENTETNRFRRGAEDAPQGRACDPFCRLGLVGVSAQGPGELGVVEHERDAEERHASGQRALHERRQAPALGAPGLEERLGGGAALRVGVGRGEQRRRAAVQHGLRRAHGDDEVGLDELAGNAHPWRVGRDSGELRIGCVVDGDDAVEAPAKLRSDECRYLRPAHAAAEPARDEQRLAAGLDAELFERFADGRDRQAPRVGGHAPDRQGRRLDHDRHTGPRCHERLERLSVQRESQRLARRCLDVRRAPRRRRSQDTRVGRRRGHHEARAGDERDARHSRIQPAKFAA